MKSTILYFGVCWCIGIVQQQNVDECTSLILHSRSIRRGWVGVICKIMLWACVGGEVYLCRPHVCLVLSHLTETKSFLLSCLIRQLKGEILVREVVDIHTIVLLHPLMISNRRLCGGHWIVPRNARIVREQSTSHLVIIVRGFSFQNVHPCVVILVHSW